MIEQGTYQDVVVHLAEGHEGLVAEGAGGDQNEWLVGVAGEMVEHGAATSQEPWTRVINVEMGGINHLVMFFDPKVVLVGRLAIVRLGLLSVHLKWASDWRDHHNPGVDAYDQERDDRLQEI